MNRVRGKGRGAVSRLLRRARVGGGGGGGRVGDRVLEVEGHGVVLVRGVLVERALEVADVRQVGALGPLVYLALVFEHGDEERGAVAHLKRMGGV
jgi:hypothetical protein